jgi:hypothetical protein
LIALYREKRQGLRITASGGLNAVSRVSGFGASFPFLLAPVEVG